MRTPDVWPVIIAIAFVLSGGCSSGAGGKDDPEAGMADAGPGGADGGGDGGFVQPTKGPGKVLDFSAALDPAGLALEIDVDASATVPVRSVDSEVFLLEFTYRSQKLFGHQWEHDASLFVPRRLHPDLPPGAFAIIQLGTPNEQPGVSDTMSFRANYAGTVAAGLGIPVLVVPGVPGRVDLSAQSNWEGLAPAQCYVDGLPEDRYLSCLLRILAATGDLEADPFRYIAFSWMRTVTAAQRAVREARTVSWGDDAPIDLELEQAVILADGARAVGARMAAAVDPRVVGVFGGGADFADVENLLSSMESRWSSETGWFEELDSFRAFVDSADGRRWLDSVDPSRYGDMLAGKSFVNATGTNDPNFPLGHGASMRAAFPADTNRIVVHDYGAGVGASAHLNGWYAFLGHVFLGSPWSRVSATFAFDGGNVAVEASTEGDGSVTGAQLWSVQQHRTSDDEDFRDAVWILAAMEQQNGAWRGTVAPIASNAAGYVVVVEESGVSTILDEPAEFTVQAEWSSVVDIDLLDSM